ncbi:beta-galactosidase [Catenovulum sediminis]|uniref:Beta-galactosidase n=1 Tax=Catenovulum sediminis TaxID=1740262 RepID=A0ABV1RN70_9ALTE
MVNKLKISVVCMSLALAACSDPGHKTENTNMLTPAKQSVTTDSVLTLENFEQPDAMLQIVQEGAQSKLVSSGENTSLKITFEQSALESYVSLKPQTPWDWSTLGDINLAADIKNTSDTSIQIYVQIFNPYGAFHERSISIPAGYKGTYYGVLTGEQMTIDSGLREDPKSWETDDHKMFWMRGYKGMQMNAISEIRFKTLARKYEKSIEIDNLRIRQNPEFNLAYLRDLADKFGQSHKFDYPTKIKTDAQLKAVAEAEIKQLEEEGTMADRSEFGGWASGPKLEATGFFRTEKVDGKWAIIDPQGHLFFSSALANIRIANTTTYTGVDFKDDSVRYKDPEDVTPEDSLGIRPVSKEAQKTAFVTSELRHKMFTWLPDYDDPLANHYSYRRESHKGPIEHGETFSFYQANLERRYGESYPDSYLDKWRDVTIKRFKNWGFTSTGNWADASFYQMNQIPYFANGWIIGDFKTVTSGNDIWSRMPDPFDPEFKRRARVTVEVIAEEVQNNPYCIGIFVDNEKSWGNNSSLQKRYAIVLHTLKNKLQDSPAKTHFVKMLKEKHASIDDLNNAWGTQIASWQVLGEGVDIVGHPINDAMQQDLSDLSFAYAEAYFKTVHDELEKVLPNHMYMGVRMAAWGLTHEAARAAAKYADIMSYNYYREYAHEKAWAFLEKLDKPSLIGEYHIGATSDTGLYHPGLIHAANQQDRARMYKDYMQSVIDNPYMVGAHWFQYLDSPITGRAHDGENYNTGFVTMADVPYAKMVDAAKEINRQLYQRKFGDVKVK